MSCAIHYHTYICLRVKQSWSPNPRLIPHYIVTFPSSSLHLGDSLYKPRFTGAVPPPPPPMNTLPYHRHVVVTGAFLRLGRGFLLFSPLLRVSSFPPLGIASPPPRVNVYIPFRQAMVKECSVFFPSSPL